MRQLPLVAAGSARCVKPNTFRCVSLRALVTAWRVLRYLGVQVPLIEVSGSQTGEETRIAWLLMRSDGVTICRALRFAPNIYSGNHRACIPVRRSLLLYAFAILSAHLDTSLCSIKWCSLL